MSNLIAAEVFPPGEILREELEARGWTQLELAEILNRPPRLISEIIGAKRAISPETAQGLGEVFGTGGQFWMNLESAWQLSKVSGKHSDVGRRAELYKKVPVNEMLRRHWIQPTSDVAQLRSHLLTFLKARSLDDEPAFAHAARKHSSGLTWPQKAWLCRAEQLAVATHAQRFTKANIARAIDGLHALLPNAEEVRRVPHLLADLGIRLVIVEPLAGTRIDGASFWLNSQAHSPVIALSLRYDRIDWFWFTLMHEIGHVREGDRRDCNLDTDLVGDAATSDKEESELAADRFATEALISEAQLDGFVARTAPLYSKERIRGFAASIGVHPGVVVGQLQKRGEIPNSHSRDMLAKVKRIVTQSTLTDGWGYSPQVGS
jgi:HTH-type transcriptional regulator/antitoxin HigA